MGVTPSSTNAGSNANALAAQEAARRAAEEVARRAAEAAARRAAEEAAKMAAAEAARRQAVENTRGKSTFDPTSQRTGPALDGQPAPSSSLLTEDTGDGQTNCLDLAADWVANTTPELRGRSELLFLKDTRAGAEGQSGHVVVRQGDRILDPTTQKSYASTGEYLKENPQYQQVGALSGSKAAKIFSTAPGSPERQQALDDAKVSPELQKMMVADPGGSADTKRSLNPDAVAAANKDYDALKKGDPNGYEVPAIALLHQHAGDPDYLAQLVGRMKEGGAEDAVLNKVLTAVYAPGDTGGFKRPDVDREKVTGALKAAVEAGTLTEADVNVLARGYANEIWKAISPQLGIAVYDVSGTVNAVKTQMAEVDKSLAAVNKKEQELADHLAAFGPALTEEQRKAYVKSFQNDPKNLQTYTDHQAALGKLAQALGTNADALHAAGQGRPEDAKAIAHAMSLLANSPDHAEATVKLAGELTTLDPGSTILAEPEAAEALEDAINQTALKYMVESESPEAGLEKLNAVMEPFKYATKGSKDSYKLANGSTIYGAIADSKAKKYDRLQSLIKGAKDPVARGMARALIGFGALGAVSAAEKGDFEKMLKEAGSASKEALTLVAQSTASASETGKWMKMTADPEKLKKFSTVAGRLAPGIGIGAAALSAHLHYEGLKEGPNAGLELALLGDIISGAGAILELTPAAPLGGLISAGGGVITATGEMINLFLKQGKIQEDQRKYLEAAGVPKKLIDAMADADEEQVNALVKGMGIPPERLQGILSRCPELLDGQTPGVRQLEAIFKSRDVHDTAAADMLDKMTQAASDADVKQALFYIANSAQYSFSGKDLGALTREEWDLVLNNARRDATEDGAKKALDALG